MIFSKSLSYAIRSVLYIAVMQDTKRFVQAEEIADKLGVPRHFESKILKKLAKAGVIASVKGPMGGFTLTKTTLGLTLYDLHDKMEGSETFHSCVLRLRECSEDHPCPMHSSMKQMRDQLKSFLQQTSFADLLKGDAEILINSISMARTYNGDDVIQL
jgi:Rrf2 family transcriptional regulator, iron-sulfur cluster assembly transcription factor